MNALRSSRREYAGFFAQNLITAARIHDNATPLCVAGSH